MHSGHTLNLGCRIYLLFTSIYLPNGPRTVLTSFIKSWSTPVSSIALCMISAIFLSETIVKSSESCIELIDVTFLYKWPIPRTSARDWMLLAFDQRSILIYIAADVNLGLLSGIIGSFAKHIREPP